MCLHMYVHVMVNPSVCMYVRMHVHTYVCIPSHVCPGRGEERGEGGSAGESGQVSCNSGQHFDQTNRPLQTKRCVHYSMSLHINTACQIVCMYICTYSRTVLAFYPSIYVPYTYKLSWDETFTDGRFSLFSRICL